MKNDTKQRITAFVDTSLMTRVKVRGALEGLTISEMIERALEEYAPRIEKDNNKGINLKFISGPEVDTLIPNIKTKRAIPKRTKSLVVPR